MTNGDILYRLVTSAEQNAQLRTWARRAAARGTTAKYTAALKAISQHLTTVPATWGDPCNQLVYLGLQVYHGIFPPLYIAYTIDEERRIVYVKTLKALPRSGLETDE
jgi:hypothetical protein